ncbi:MULTISPECIES: DUF397 domain-containing protein [unclassified Streptomyces]|uniref:DUF397 domain-containing protein n=1 Tax=unclassified Streptomyces TaxID=2593676 RepID=UPI0033C6FF18
MSEQLAWTKSSYSNSEGGDCLEVARDRGEFLHIRDSKLPASPQITVTAPAWSAFIGAVQPGA